MIKINIRLDEVKDKIISDIAKEIKKGKTIAYPTDTIYGLGCDATDRQAIKKIYRIKKRNNDKPLLVLISSWAMLKKYFQANQKQLDYLKKVWPGPVTVILNTRNNLPVELNKGRKDLAVRFPDHDFLARLIKKLKAPLVSTSLNIEGHAPLASLEDIEDHLDSKFVPDILIDAGKSKKKKPSRIADIRDMEKIVVIRK